MMRLISLVFLFITLISCSNTQPDSFTLEGHVKGIEGIEIIALSYPSLQNDRWIAIADTAKIIDGKFFFKGKIDELTPAALDIGNMCIRIYIEPTDMKLTLDASQPYAYELSGGKVQKEDIELRKELEPTEKIQHERLGEIFKVLDRLNLNRDEEVVRDSLINIFNQHMEQRAILTERLDKMRLDFVSRHNAYQIAPHLLYLVSKNDIINVDTIKSIYNTLPERSKATLVGKIAGREIESIEIVRNSLVGGTAPGFKGIDLSGEIVQLSEFRDKNYVLLDFWASWCGPCLKEIPKMKKIHNQYRDRGLVIIGISCDTDKNNWLKAIDKHELKAWTQILSTQGADNSVFNEDDIADFYNVKAIPFCILIDKEGKVVARWQHIGEEELIELDAILNAQF